MNRGLRVTLSGSEANELGLVPVTAIGPPCIYLGQVISIRRKRDSEGFSQDVCAVLLIANICRCVFWLGTQRPGVCTRSCFDTLLC